MPTGIMLLKKAIFSNTDKAVWYMEMGRMTKLFMVSLKQLLLSNLIPTEKVLGYMVLDLLVITFLTC